MNFLYTIVLWVHLLGFSLASPIHEDNALVSRDGADYWVAGVKHQGLVAFGNSTEYQIFRNVKDFGAKGRSHREVPISSAQSLMDAQVTARPMTRQPSTRPFRPGTAVDRAATRPP